MKIILKWKEEAIKERQQPLQQIQIPITIGLKIQIRTKDVKETQKKIGKVFVGEYELKTKQ